MADPVSTPPPTGFRCGLVVLVGRTNAGKSTLLNALVNNHLAIVTPKPQTTRQAIHGVIHRPEAQIILVDTPGFYHTRRSELVDRLHARTQSALGDADAVVHVIDPSRSPGLEEAMVRSAIEKTSVPRLLCLTKSDLAKRPHLATYRQQGPQYAATVEVSAQTRRDLESLIQALVPLLPVADPLYPPDEITNAHRDFRITECVREAIYQLTGEEVPYRTAVRLESLDEGPQDAEGGGRARVLASILVGDDRYKGMLIGARGRMVKNLRKTARPALERLLERPVDLQLEIRVTQHLPLGEFR